MVLVPVGCWQAGNLRRPEHLWRLVGLGQVEVDEVSGSVDVGVGPVFVELGHRRSSWLHMVVRA